MFSWRKCLEMKVLLSCWFFFSWLKMDPRGNDSTESMKGSRSVGTGCYKLSENVSQQMVFLPVRCLINCSWGHSSEDLNCFLYPQLPFITLAAGYFTLAGGLNLTGTAPKRFMLGGKTPTSQMDLNWWVKRQRLVLISALQNITQWAHRCPNHYSVWSRQVRLCQELASAPSSRQMATHMFWVGSLVFMSCVVMQKAHKGAPKPTLQWERSGTRTWKKAFEVWLVWRAEQTALLFHCCLT